MFIGAGPPILYAPSPPPPPPPVFFAPPVPRWCCGPQPAYRYWPY